MRLPVLLLEINIYRPCGTTTDIRRAQENEAARILIGIVVVFIICHTLRVITDVYEMIYIENITDCHARGNRGVHTWVLILNEFSSAMITLNSSVNMIIYGLIKPNIRNTIFSCENIFTRRYQTQEAGVFEMEEIVTIQKTTLHLVDPTITDDITL